MLLSASKLLLLIIALSADSFAAGFSYGADRVKIPLTSAAVIAFLSDFLLLLSLLLGNLFKSFLPESFTVVLSFSILFLLGFFKIFDCSLKKKIKEVNTEDVETLSPAEALSLGLALSLDSAAAGVGAASAEFSLLLTSVLTFLISIASISGGCRIGRSLAAKSEFNFSIIGGVILLLLAFMKIG